MSYLVDALEFLGAVPDFTQPGSSWRHVQIVFENTGTGDTRDNAIVTLDLANITGGVLDDSWTAGDYTTVDNQLTSLCGAWQQRASNWARAKEIRYYKRAFNPMSNVKPFTISGPPEHVHAVGLLGQGGTFQAPQVALTHTEKTTYPHHWGRCYWPFVDAAFMVAGGVWDTAATDGWAASVESVYDALAAAEFFPCVPTTQVLKAPSRNLLGVTAIQVDNNLDVVRRRRVHTTTHRKSLPT